MKIALTADNHLTSIQAAPERYNAFEYILNDMLEQNAGHLIVAGDLFNETVRNYSDFEGSCSKKAFRDIQIWIIPGNHDIQIRDQQFAAGNVHVIDDARLHRFGPGDIAFLLVPFRKNTTMGACIASFAKELEPGRWILAGHGDWVEGIRQPNPLEPGVYMPLGRADIELFKPAAVLLGHIHKPQDGTVYYTGSPCPLDIHETGRRRYLIADSETGRVESRNVEADILYFDEAFLVLPVPDEASFLTGQIRKRMEKWQIGPGETGKVRVRVKVMGYTADKGKLMQTLTESFQGYAFYEEPGLENVYFADEAEKSEIANRVLAKLKGLERTVRDDDPGDDEILLHALHTVYGE